MNQLLEISGLSLRGPAGPLVDDVTLSLERGRTLALLGENGAGKSLTALAALNLLPAGVRRSAGRIAIAGRDIDSLDAAGLRALRGGRAAMIMQNPASAFNPLLSLRGHFAESLRAHGRDGGKDHTADAARRALLEAGFSETGDEGDAAGLDELLDAYPFQLSGGMLQRAMIALALLHGPSLLIADEATTDLDVLAQKRIVDLLRERRASLGLGLLLITHDLGVAAALADRVAVLRHGRILEQGPAAEVFAAPRSPYTKALLQAHLGLYGNRFAEFFRGGAPAGRGAARDPAQRVGHAS